MARATDLDDLEYRPSKKAKLSSDDDSTYASIPSPQDDAFLLALQSSPHEPDGISVDSTYSKRLKTLLCPFEGCDRVFDRPARLEIHTRQHTNERPFVCDEPDCEKTFARSEHLKAHVLAKHNDERNYICDYELAKDDEGTPVVCGKAFHTGTKLRRHVAAHEEKQHTRCQECGKVFRKLETLQRHIKSVHLGEDAYRCTFTSSTQEECGQTFATASQLKTHHSKQHSGKRYFCQLCQDANTSRDGFDTYADLRLHLKHQHPPRCGICGQNCVSNRALKAHLDIAHSTATSRQSFACDQAGCNRKFTKKGNLEVHIRTVHAREKPFVCGQFDLSHSARVSGWSGIGCGTAFGSKQGLEGHIRTQHLHVPLFDRDDSTTRTVVDTSVSRITGHGYEETRPLECLEHGCMTRFRAEHELVVHLELHHGWNIDDINDRLTEAMALTSDRFWVGGLDEDEDMFASDLPRAAGHNMMPYTGLLDPSLDRRRTAIDMKTHEEKMHLAEWP